MPKQPKNKSTHLQELEAVFDRHTRRFSPFDVLGLRPQAAEETPALQPEDTQQSISPSHRGVDATHPHEDGETKSVSEERIHTSVSPPTHTGVDPTHIRVDSTHPH